ncbi:MAG: hypothetical protein CVV47_02200 [Spirochaetae bacterium HGW-Spirochaetae-3]|nr:MAG: hypothetical protein CVV47_02200 [Spirochaetae bacterium HGW-Spirochaetae-3]
MRCISGSEQSASGDHGEAYADTAGIISGTKERPGRKGARPTLTARQPKAEIDLRRASENGPCPSSVRTVESLRKRRELPPADAADFPIIDSARYWVIDYHFGLDVEIPRHLSVAGFNDDWFSLHSRPRLTTGHQDVADKGKAVAEILMHLIDKEAVPSSGSYRRKPRATRTGSGTWRAELTRPLQTQ